LVIWRLSGFLTGMLLVLSLTICGDVQSQSLADALDYSKIGVHTLLDDGRNYWVPEAWAAHMDYAAAISGPGGITVQVIRADDMRVNKWQHFMDHARDRDLTPVLRLATTFDRDNGVWNPPATDEFGTYLDWGQRYAAFINGLVWPDPSAKHMIILNEPNNGHEWGRRPDPVAYAQFFAQVADTLKREVPGVVILNGAIDLYAPDTGTQPFPNSDTYFINAANFMDAMVAAVPDVFDYVDVWNSHSYPMHTFTAAPWERDYHFDVMHDAPPMTDNPPDRVLNRGINGYEWELWKLESYGVDTSALPIMITETGWRHNAGDADSADYMAGYPSPERAAQYLDMAMRGNLDGRYPDAPPEGWLPWLADERVVGVAYFALDGVPWEWSHTNLLIVAENGDILGAHAHYEVLAGYFMD